MMRNKNLTTKIIGGKYRGKTLYLPDLKVTRSSKSILKESLFNVLQYEIIDKIFIEAFGGSGSIGLEAISRGAKEVYFYEINRNSYKILKKNCDAVQPESCNAFLGDTFDNLPNLLETISNTDEIILYFDPPFDYRQNMENIYNDTFKLISNIKNNNIKLIVFEHLCSAILPITLGKFNKIKTKKFGKSSLSYYEEFYDV